MAKGSRLRRSSSLVRILIGLAAITASVQLVFLAYDWLGSPTMTGTTLDVLIVVAIGFALAYGVFVFYYRIRDEQRKGS